mgnify:CR=1 FL=1
MNAAHITIVVPCLNEADNVCELYRQIEHELKGTSFDCIFVDDGSSDNTLEVIKSLRLQHENVGYISFSRNFGHQKALLAGIRSANADAVVMLDADLQQPPAVIPKMIRLWEDGYEIVNAVRRKSAGKGFFKRTSSEAFYMVFRFLTGLDLRVGAADFRLIDRRVAEFVGQCPEDNMFLRGMFSWCGFRQASVEFEENARFSGKTKYPLAKMVALSVEGITSFSVRPLRLAMLFAAMFALFALASAAYALYVKLFTGDAVPGWASMAVLVSLAGACNMVVLGVVGEYVGRAFMQGKHRPQYVIREASEGAAGKN